MTDFFKKSYILNNPISSKDDSWNKMTAEQKFADTASDIPMAIIKYGLLYILVAVILVIAMVAAGILDEKIVFKVLNEQFKKVEF